MERSNFYTQFVVGKKLYKVKAKQAQKDDLFAQSFPTILITTALLEYLPVIKMPCIIMGEKEAAVIDTAASGCNSTGLIFYERKIKSTYKISSKTYFLRKGFVTVDPFIKISFNLIHLSWLPSVVPARPVVFRSVVS